MNPIFSHQTTREMKRVQKKSYFKALTASGKAEYPDMARKHVRAQIRQVIRKNWDSAPSQFAGMPSRRQRRFTAKLNGDLFVPVFNN